MSKKSLLALSALAFICGLLWVSTYHLTGLAAVVVIGLPLVLGALSARYGL